MISDTISDKLEKKEIVVLIDSLKAAAASLLALLQLYLTLMGNWKIKGSFEIYLLPFISKPNSQNAFARELDILDVNLTPQIFYLQNIHCNKFSHGWPDTRATPN